MKIPKEAQVKKTQQEFLLLLLSDIESGLMLTQMAKHLGKSKQALNYHIKRLRRIGLIERVQSYPYSLHKLTPLGLRVKENIRYPDGVKKPTWRCHALQVGFPVEDFGTYNFLETKSRSVSSMKGWKYTSEQIGQHHVKIQDTGLMIVSCPDIYTNNPDEAWAKMYEQAAQIAENYRNRYGMELKALKIIRRGQKSLVGSEILSKLFGKGKIAKEMWVDASGGTDELEEHQDSNAIEDLLKLPEQIKVMTEQIAGFAEQSRQMTEQTGAFAEQGRLYAEQIKLHMAVMQDMRDTLKEIRDEFRSKNLNNKEKS